MKYVTIDVLAKKIGVNHGTLKSIILPILKKNSSEPIVVKMNVYCEISVDNFNSALLDYVSNYEPKIKRGKGRPNWIDLVIAKGYLETIK